MTYAQTLREQAAALRIRARTMILLHSWRLHIQAQNLDAEADAIEARAAQENTETTA